MTRHASEVNFDGLVGPTHNYAGLAFGNLASTRHGFTRSKPRAAFFQGLEKMKLLSDLGLVQAVLPPHERPDLSTLRRLGFSGSDEQVMAAAAKQAPLLFASCFSSSGMWAANSATVSPSADTGDGRVHFTAANLVSQVHRSIEASFTSRVLAAIFRDEGKFVHHEPLPGGSVISDEGAANHTRLCRNYGGPGIEVFTYGREALNPAERGPSVFPARQSLEASESVSRLHLLERSRTLFVRQNPDVIDLGVFHNDVISVGNGSVFLYHERAFQDTGPMLDTVRQVFSNTCNEDLVLVPVRTDELPLQEAVGSYLFNSQLVTLPDGTMCLVAPTECLQVRNASRVLRRVIEGDNPIRSAKYVDVRESMKNGGGPACLRLRVVLTEDEAAAAHQGVFLSDHLYESLIRWGNRYYREELHVNDLVDPSLLLETRTALDELTGILGLGPLYCFQTA